MRLRDRFPFELIEVPGWDALKAWETGKVSPSGGVPVVLGPMEEAEIVAESIADPASGSVDRILEAAAPLRHPEDMIEAFRAQDRHWEILAEKLPPSDKSPYPLAMIITSDGTLLNLNQEQSDAYFRLGIPLEDPWFGVWPEVPEASVGLTVARDYSNGRYFERVFVAVLPTDDWTAIPAYLNWGGWNQCPAPKHHVAAFRSWRDRFGAELVGMDSATINVRVA